MVSNIPNFSTDHATVLTVQNLNQIYKGNFKVIRSYFIEGLGINIRNKGNPGLFLTSGIVRYIGFAINRKLLTSDLVV